MSVIKMTDLDLKGKRVLIRSDLNVPVKDGKVTSDARITASMATINHALKAGAKVMVTSHLGRPEEGISESLPDLTPGPASEVDQREQNRMVNDAYAQLTPEQQHVLALRFGQGYSLEETAATMNKNVNAVKALQFRALAALQREVGEVNYE